MVEIITAKPKQVKKLVSFRIHASTASDLETLKQRVKSAGDEVGFHLDDAVDRHLSKLIKTANKQLDALAPTTQVASRAFVAPPSE